MTLSASSLRGNSGSFENERHIIPTKASDDVRHHRIFEGLFYLKNVAMLRSIDCFYCKN